MINDALITEINKNLALRLPGGIDMEDLATRLAASINELVQQDFDYLVSLLYRIDVDETRLKKLLQQQPAQNAGELIAALVIERQLQKIASREYYRQRNNDAEDHNDEKW